MHKKENYIKVIQQEVRCTYNKINNTLIEDLKKLELNANIIYNHIKSLPYPEALSKLAQLSKNIETNTIKNFAITIYQKNSSEIDTKNYTRLNYYIIYKRPLSNDYDIVLKVDPLEISSLLEKTILDNKIKFTINNSSKGRYAELASNEIELGENIKLHLYYNPKDIIDEYENILVKKLTLIFFLYIVGVFIYFVMRISLKKYLLNTYVRTINRLTSELSKLKNDVYILTSELKLVNDYITATKDEKKLHNFFNSHLNKIKHYSSLLLNNEQNETTIISIHHKKIFLQDIIKLTTALEQNLIIEQINTYINVKESLEFIIKLLSVKVSSKNLNISVNSNIEFLDLSIGENAFKQIILSILSYQATSLPQGTNIYITCLIKEGFLHFRFLDNGFGLEFKDLKNYIDTSDNDSSLILSWQALEESLNQHSIKFKYSNNQGGLFELLFPLIAEEKENIGEKSNVHYLHKIKS